MAVFLVTIPVAGALSVLDGTVGHLAGVVNPAWVVSGVGAWLAHHEAPIEIGGTGPAYAVAAVVWVAACLAVLLARYRKVEQ